MLYEYRLFHCIHKNGWYLEEIVEDVETRFDTSNYELDRPLPKGKKEKSNWINDRWIRWKNHEMIFSIKNL